MKTFYCFLLAGAWAAAQVPASKLDLARRAFEKRDAAQAIQIAHRALESGENADLRNLLGKAYALSGQPEQAIAQLQTAIRLRPDSEEFRFDLGQFLLKSQNYQAAVSALEDAHQRLPRSAQIQLALGVAYYCSVRYEDAISAFLKTIDLAPEVPQPYVFLGKTLEHAEPRLQEIARKCALVERLNPSNPYAPLLHAQVLIAQLRPNDEPSKSQAAVTLLEKTIALESDSTEAYFALGCLMDREGNYPRAVQLLEKYVQLKPDNAAARYRLGRLYVRLGNRPQADAEFAVQAKLKQAGRPAVN